MKKYTNSITRGEKMAEVKKGKKEAVSKRKTNIEEAVAHGLQADHPFHTGARYSGSAEEEPRLVEEDNADLADKEISQVYHNS